MLLPLLLLLQQAAPAGPTVGDTIWLERVVETPSGAEVHAAQWTPAEPMGLLGHALLRREGNKTIVSYPAVAWRAGRIQVDVPGPIVIRPDGTTDSLPVESRTLNIVSVLPDSVPAEKLPVQPEAGIVTERVTTPYPVLVAVLVALLIFAPLAWWWLRSGPPMPGFTAGGAPVAPPLDEWNEAGEPRAVAAVAARGLRATMLSHLPGMPQGLHAGRLMRVVAEQRPSWPVAELGDVLGGLEAVQYDSAPSHDVLALARRAADLQQQLQAMPARTPAQV
ncbi:MAG TPA: hypothetical protein VLD58_15125 [Gemmatimonadales bacterium]|nr:hypothetical protein [Gemmatimonadales bacterium]